jgi:hypothetical protein
MAGAGILQDIPKMVRLTEAGGQSHESARHGEDPTWAGTNTPKIIVEVAERFQDIGIQGPEHPRPHAQADVQRRGRLDADGPR